MDMQFNDDRELVLFLKPDKKKDKNTLNLAKQVSAHIRDVDVMRENLTATKIIEILQILNLKPQDLIDKESDIYMKEYEGKEFEIRGIVTKVNKEIMGKNWVHLQDGTSKDGAFDLTITTQDLPKINDEVTFKGTVTLEKDFGAGYYYDVIMEDANQVKSETKAIL